MIDQAIAGFLAHLKYERGAARNTIIAYRTDLFQFRGVLRDDRGGGIQASDLAKGDVESYLDWLSEQEYKSSTISRKLAALRSFLRYLGSRDGLVIAGLLEQLKWESPERPRPFALSRQQIGRLLQAPAGRTGARDIRDAAILALVYATGLRAAEAVELTVHDIDLERGVLDRPKGERDPLPLRMAYHPVERYIKEGRPQLLRDRGEATLFLNQRGEGLSRQGLWLVVKKWAERCGLGEEVSPYTLRHSLTRHLLQAGRSKDEVQELLGLSSPNTIRYHLRAQNA